MREKTLSLTSRLKQLRVASGIPGIKRIDPGFSYLIWNDAIREEMLKGTFEAAEQKFVVRYLRPGMTVLDIGAYYGLYSLIAALKVGPHGRVVAFEPSPVQRKRLRWNLVLNRIKNVRLEPIALSSNEGESEFFSVLEGGGGFSGLQNPHVAMKMQTIKVLLTTLDAYLSKHPSRSVDFIKIDVEGGELEVFRGATTALSNRPRPVILCELQDVRSEAWGHTAKETAAFLQHFDFQWFNVLPDGSLGSVGDNRNENERNFVAVPAERISQIEELLSR